jgi:hypothetical protein
MPIIRKAHLARAQFERGMADQSASNVERIIHNKLADLHSIAGHARPAESLVDGEAV